MWHYLVKTATGALASESSLDIPSVPAGMEVKSYTDRQSQTKMWDEGLVDFVDRPVQATVLPAREFLDKFTKQEQKKIIKRAKTDEDIELVLERLNILSSAEMGPDTLAALQYLEVLGDLDVGRALEIFNG